MFYSIKKNQLLLTLCSFYSSIYSSNNQSNKTNTNEESDIEEKEQELTQEEMQKIRYRVRNIISLEEEQFYEKCLNEMVLDIEKTQDPRIFILGRVHTFEPSLVLNTRFTEKSCFLFPRTNEFMIPFHKIYPLLACDVYHEFEKDDNFNIPNVIVGDTIKNTIKRTNPPTQKQIERAEKYLGIHFNIHEQIISHLSHSQKELLDAIDNEIFKMLGEEREEKQEIINSRNRITQCLKKKIQREEKKKRILKVQKEEFNIMRINVRNFEKRLNEVPVVGSLIIGHIGDTLRKNHPFLCNIIVLQIERWCKLFHLNEFRHGTQFSKTMDKIDKYEKITEKISIELITDEKKRQEFFVDLFRLLRLKLKLYLLQIEHRKIVKLEPMKVELGYFKTFFKENREIIETYELEEVKRLNKDEYKRYKKIFYVRY